MSLINKMLTDLDARVDSTAAADRAPDIFTGLRPANEPCAPAPRVRPRLWLALSGAMIVAGIALWAYPTGRAPENGPVVAHPPRDTSQGATPESTVASALESAARGGDSARPVNGEEETMPDRPPVTKTPYPAANTATSAPDAGPREARVAAASTPDRPTGGSSQPIAATVAPAVDGTARADPAKQPPVKTFRSIAAETRPDALYRRAVRLRARGRLAEAEGLLRQVLKEQAAHIEAREALADLMVRQGRWQEAEVVLARGITLFPTRVDFTRALARLYAESGDVPRAVTLLESALPHASGNAEYKGLLAALYQRLGRHRAAVDMYDQALALRPFAGQWWAGMGISLEARGDWAGARDAYLRVTTDDDVDEPLAAYARERLRHVTRRLEVIRQDDDG